MMAEGHRLGRLQMREARHDITGMLQRALRQPLDQGGQLGVERVQRVADPHAEIGRDLVVARARRVQASGRRPDQLCEPRLDVHVNVFQRALEGEGAGLDF